MLYHHLDSKEGLFDAVVESFHAPIIARQKAVSAASASPLEIMRRALEDLFAFLDAHPEFVRSTGWLMLSGARPPGVAERTRDFVLNVLEPRVEAMSGQDGWAPELSALHILFLIRSLAIVRFLDREEFHELAGEGTAADRDGSPLRLLLAVLEGGLRGTLQAGRGR